MDKILCFVQNNNPLKKNENNTLYKKLRQFSQGIETNHRQNLSKKLRSRFENIRNEVQAR